MLCRQCGAEIADKAIVCYRCGAGTTEPVRKPAAVRPRRSNLLSFVALTVLIILGLFLGQAGRTAEAAHATGFEIAAGACLAVALVILLRRLLRRR